MNIKVKKLQVKKDRRGWLAELIREEDVYQKKFGQLGITTARPGQIKGGHYHKRKREWFCVVQGRGLLKLVDRFTGNNEEIEIGERNMVLVEIPREHLHWIENIGKNEMHLLFYTDEVFDPEDPDTYS